MMENAKNQIRRILVVGDAYVSPAALTEAAHTLPFENPVMIALKEDIQCCKIQKGKYCKRLRM